MTLFLTIFAAILLMILVVMLLLVGKLITGKTRLTRGTCGKNPKDKSDQGCSLCGTSKKCDEKEKDEP
jgi:hypothetical protein